MAEGLQVGLFVGHRSIQPMFTPQQRDAVKPDSWETWSLPWVEQSLEQRIDLPASHV